MSTSKKNEFSLSIMLVIGLVVAVSVIYLFVLAMAKDGYGKNMARVHQQGDAGLVARIKPVETLDDILGGAKAAPVKAVAKVKSGEDLFNAVCTACHSTGAAGAPKLGDADAWRPRAAQGVDGLLASAKAGKGAMPPKGGSSFSDAELKRIIEFMLSKAGLLKASAPAPAAATAAAPATESQPAETASDMQNQASVMDVKSDAPAAASTGDAVAGEATYKKVCFACHDFGVANAPKLGNKDAWGPRIATGFDSLLNSALHGKGAMPPKGGNAALSEDDIKNVITFMISKAK